jgi:outer membrane murein-binding lipoprotein Lpp
MLDDKLGEGQIASLEEQLANLTREAGVSPSAPPISMKRSRAPLATIYRLADWRHVAFVGSLLAASIGVAAWLWSSSVDTAMMAPSDPAPLTQAAPEAVPPKNVAPTAVALSSELAQQLQPMARDLAASMQTVEQLKVKQEQLVRDNENLASQLKASREEMARNNSTIDEIKATQIQMARESQTLTERLNASQEQLARVIANASEQRAVPEAPKVVPEESKVHPEEPKVMPEIPLPRPRQTANLAQTQKPAPTPARPQAQKPQPPFAWPWSVR